MRWISLDMPEGKVRMSRRATDEIAGALQFLADQCPFIKEMASMSHLILAALVLLPRLLGTGR